MWERKMWHKTEGVENAGQENAAANCKGKWCTRSPGWKMQERKM